MADKTRPFRVAFGGESFLLDREGMKARSWKERQVVALDGDGLSDYDLVGVCRTLPFDGRSLVVVLDNAQKVKGDKNLKGYIEAKDVTDTSVVLHAIVRSEKLPAVWDLASKKGWVKEYSKFKGYDDAGVIAWIKKEAADLGLRLTEGVPNIMLTFLGHNIGALAGELQKLQFLVGRGNDVTVEHLKLVLSPSPQAEAWQVAEAAADKDFRRALNLLSILYRGEGGAAHVPVTSALMRQVEKLMVARHMFDAKMSEDEMAAGLGMHPYRFRKFFLPTVQKHRMPDLLRHMARLCQLDADVKSSAQSRRSLVELTVLSITQ
jgi:DNA polymerase III delta subunit